MSFVFISHAQADKLRPDGRLRALVRFLADAGIPLWIDRPEELGIDARLLKDRCVSLNGSWTSDIRTALTNCAGGIGIWSHHAFHRLHDDPAGVLFQEMNSLSVRGRLFLLKIDPDVGDLGGSLGQLSDTQQFLDIGAGDMDAFRRRISRLVERLGEVTGVKQHHTRLYSDAVAAQGTPSDAFGDMLSPTRKAARESARNLLAAFRVLDPGRMPASLTPELAAALQRQIDACQRAQAPFRAFHRLIAVMQAPSRFGQICFDEVEIGLGARIETWLKQQADAQPSREPGGFLPLDLVKDKTVVAAARLAESEGNRRIDERHLLLAILDDTLSGTVASLRKHLGADRVTGLRSVAQSRRPTPPPDFQITGPLGPIP